MRSYLKRRDLDELLRQKNKQLHAKLNYEICSHPTQLYDLNRRIQYRNNKPKYLKQVLLAQALYLDEVLKDYINSEIIDYTVYDISRTILLYTSNKYNITINH